MGADFIWARADVTETKHTWFDRITQMSHEDTIRFVHDTEDFLMLADMCDDADNDEELVTKVKERLTEAVDIVYGYHSNREMGWFIEGDRTYALTGGMSWGDDPTEVLQDVVLFAELQKYS
jgi:hypothetical protein